MSVKEFYLEPASWEKNRKQAAFKRSWFLKEKPSRQRLFEMQREMRYAKPPRLPVTLEPQKGQWLSGVIVKIKKNGVWISVGAPVDGFCHVKDLSTHYVQHPSHSVRLGQTVEACVKAYDGRLSLSLIPLENTVLEGKPVSEFEIDQQVEARVIRSSPYAFYCDIGANVPGYLHVADIGLLPQKKVGAKRVPIVAPQVNEFLQRPCWIKSIDVARNRIRLSTIPKELRDDPSIVPTLEAKFADDYYD